MSEIVYILTNEYMPGLVKIGKTNNDVEDRMRSLYSTGVPIPFECIYAAEVESADKIEKVMHTAYGDSRVNDNREFFRISPEAARAILAELAIKEVTPSELFVESNEDKVAVNKARKIREAFNFDMVGIKPGEMLTFSRDDSITAQVVDSRSIKFRDEVQSLSRSALIIMNEMGYKWDRIAGPFYWKYQGEILDDIRTRMEQG